MLNTPRSAKHPLRIAALALLAVLAVRQASAAGPRWRRTPDGVIVAPAGGSARRVRLIVMTSSIIRVTAVPTGAFDLPRSLQVNAVPEPGVPFDLSAKDGAVILRTARAFAAVSLATGAVTFRDSAGKILLAATGSGTFTPTEVDGREFYAVHQEFNPGTDEALYGLGQHQNGIVNFNGADVFLRQHNMSIAVPFVVSSRDYGLLWDNDSITQFGNGRYRGVGDGLKLIDADGRTGGLTARYYVGSRLMATRDEADVNYQHIEDQKRWPDFDPTRYARAAHSAYQPDAATARLVNGEKVVWDGQIESGRTGVHKFRLYVSSYVKLYLGHQLVIDAWRQNWNPRYRNFDLPMRAGVPVPIRIEWIPHDGYIRLLHADPLPFAERHDIAFTSRVAKGIDYYFIDADSLDGVIGGYRRITGKSLLLPRWAFGFWQSRDHYKTQEQLLNTVRKYRAQHLPLDVIVQDWRYWPDDAWGSHQFDPARYPDPAEMVRAVHAMHARIMISVWPKFYPTTANYRELAAVNGVYLGNVEAGVKDWVGPGYVSTYYDPYNRKADALYWRQIQEHLGVLGIDAWWLDNDEPDIHTNAAIPERIRIMGPTAIGPAAEYYNTFPLVHVGGVYRHWHKAHPDKRVLLFTRSGYGGLQRYSAAVWSGDLAGRWSDLKDQIAAGIGMSLSGIPNWTFDIGGYALENRYSIRPTAAALAEWRELYTRWYEFGAFAPIFRSHGQGRKREIYNIAPPGTAVYRDLAWYDRLRYRLMPYIYTLAGEVYHDDSTMMRGLAMDFPGDPKAVSRNDEYMFGPAFLVAPVSQYRARTRQVYLPAGAAWYNFYTGRRFDGGESIEAAAPLGRMPLFVKAGSIMPVGPAIQYTGQKPGAPITLYVYTGADGRFTLYDDDGVSYAYRHGGFAEIPIRYDEAARRLTLDERRGTFAGMAGKRVFGVRWISGPTATAVDFAAPPDQSITYTGKEIAIARPR